MAHEDMYLDSYWEDRLSGGSYEDAPEWFWTGQDPDEDEDEVTSDEFGPYAEISDEEKYACDLYNERYSYPYRD